MLEDPFAEVQERKQERCYWRRVGFLLFGAIVFAGAAALLLYPKKAGAEEIPVYVAEHDGLTLRLLPSPCTDMTSLMLIATAPPHLQTGWRSSSSDWRMPNGQWQTFAGWWLEIKKENAGSDDDIIVLVFSDGQTGQAFKKVLLKTKGQGV